MLIFSSAVGSFKMHVLFHICSDCGRAIPGLAKGAVTKRLFVTSGTGEKLTGICVYFIRLKTDVNLSIKNIAEVKYISFVLVNFYQNGLT